MIVQLEWTVDVDLDEPGGGLEGEFFGRRHLAPLLRIATLCREVGTIRRRRGQTIVSPGGSPNSLLPKIR